MLFVGCIITFLFWKKRIGVWWFTALVSVLLIVLGCALLLPLRHFWWGDNGDEVFVGAMMSHVLHRSFFTDFYYAWLPPFYPPLYFWFVGGVGRVFHLTTLATYKAGIVMTLGAWMLLPALFFRIAHSRIQDSILRNPWFWFWMPLLAVVSLDFDTILLKPYETLSALLVLCWIGLLADRIMGNGVSRKDIFLFGISGALLFCLYYFWWFFLLPTLCILLILERTRVSKQTVLHLACIVLLMGAGSAVYWLPLLGSLMRYGMENWQATFFTPQDVVTFAPWAHLSLIGLITGCGVCTLLWQRQRSLPRAFGILAIVMYAYAFVNLTLFALGHPPAQPTKAFLFLGTLLFVAGAVYGSFALLERYRQQLGNKKSLLIAAITLLVVIPLSPFIRFLDEPVVWRQMDIDRVPTDTRNLAATIERAVPDWQERTWLSSGNPPLQYDLPLTFFLTHNPHFSHPAAQYSRRLAVVEALAAATSTSNFAAVIARAPTPTVDAFLFYTDPHTNTYPIFLWQDAYPNGGRERRLDIDPKNLDPQLWQKISVAKEWTVFLRASSTLPTKEKL